VFGDGALEGPVDLSQAVLQNLSEAQQDGRRDASQHNGIHQLFQVDPSLRVLVRMHPEMSVIAYRKVALAPTGHIVELIGVSGVPPFGRLMNLDLLYNFHVQLALTSI
jgi:hypothetical protein